MDTKKKVSNKGNSKPLPQTQQLDPANNQSQVLQPSPVAQELKNQEENRPYSSMTHLADTISMTSFNSEGNKKMDQVHITLQGKGGVGKSFISALIVQYMRGIGVNTTPVDTDPVNATLAGYKAFNTQRLELMVDGSLVERNFDSLIEQVVENEGSFVIDNGASSFIPLSYYIKENDVFSIIGESGKQVVIHTVVTGGQAMGDTLGGLATILQQMPSNVRLIVWLNEFFGDISMDGKEFEEMKVYANNKDRIHGIVRIARQTGSTFGEDVKLMLDRKITFDEVKNSSEFKLMSKSRLEKVKTAIFQQLAVVL
jgi:hypothetical protein